MEKILETHQFRPARVDVLEQADDDGASSSCWWTMSPSPIHRCRPLRASRTWYASTEPQRGAASRQVAVDRAGHGYGRGRSVLTGRR